MKKLKELLGQKNIIFCFIGLFFLIGIGLYVAELLDTKKEIIQNFQESQCDEMIGDLFFEDFQLSNDMQIEIEEIDVRMDEEHQFKEYSGKLKTVLVQMTVCKVEKGTKTVRVSGEAILTYEQEGIFNTDCTLHSLKRTETRPIYVCLQAPQQPEELEEGLKNLFANEDVEITKYTLNDAMNKIDVEYTKHIKGEILESKDLYKRTFYYYGYSDTWVKEGSDQLLDREYLNADIAGTYLCNYHDKELEIIFTKGDALYIIYDKQQYIKIGLHKNASFQEISEQDRTILLKYTDIDISYSKPQYIIRVEDGPNGTFRTFDTTEHHLIYFLIEKDSISVYLPSEGNNLERCYLFDEDKWDAIKNVK